MPMRRSSSVTTKIKYAHVPKDGKTTVWNATAEKWVMTDAPTAQQMTATENKLKDVSDKAVAANNMALSAKTAAENAQEAADEKVTMNQALDGIKSGLFECYDKDGNQLVAEKMTLQETDNGFIMMFCARRIIKRIPLTLSEPFCLKLC